MDTKTDLKTTDLTKTDLKTTDLTTESSTEAKTELTADQESRGERRRYLRFSLGLVVNVHVVGRPDPVVVEMIDIGAKGARFRLADLARRAFREPREAPVLDQQDKQGDAQRKITLDQQAAFGFVVPGQQVCVASGKVMRMQTNMRIAPDDGPADAQPADAQPADAQPADAQPADAQPADADSELALSEFVLSIERANDAFHGFLGSLMR